MSNLKLVVCVKQIIDPLMENQVGSSFETQSEENYSISNADKAAFELALKMQDKMGADIHLLSVGPERIIRGLRFCLARGGDHAIHIYQAEAMSYNAQAIAQVLADVISGIQPDLVFCGSGVKNGKKGLVPAFLTELLKLPQITGVVKLQVSSEENRVIANKKIPGGFLQIIESSLPVVVCADQGVNRLRFPDAHLMIDSQQIHIERVEKLYKEIYSPKIKLITESPPKPYPQKVFVVNGRMTVGQRLNHLLSSGLLKRKKRVLQGSLESMATELYEFLVDGKYVIR
ncbi:electron transfer flavoprotein subunit beta/FixA family protein [Chloroflexota bacterium]